MRGLGLLPLAIVLGCLGCTSAEERERQEAERRRKREAEVRDVQRAQIKSHRRREAQKAAEQEHRRVARQSAAREYVAEHRGALEPNVERALLEGRLELGMTPEQARLVIDDRAIQDIVRSANGNMAVETWWLGAPGEAPFALISFTNNRLESLTTLRRR